MIQVVKVPLVLGETRALKEHQEIWAHKAFKDLRDPQVIQDLVEPLDNLGILVAKEHKVQLVWLVLLDQPVLLASLVLQELPGHRGLLEIQDLMHLLNPPLLEEIQDQLVLLDLQDCRAVPDQMDCLATLVLLGPLV